MNKWVVAGVAAAALNLPAQSPEMFRYQGRLVDGTNLVSAVLPMSFKLYDASEGGTELYEDAAPVLVVDGLYSTYIGDNTVHGSLKNALTNANVYLELTVNGETLAPRERLVSVPYALNADAAAERSWTEIAALSNALHETRSGLQAQVDERMTQAAADARYTFHDGSNITDPGAFRDAIDAAGTAPLNDFGDSIHILLWGQSNAKGIPENLIALDEELFYGVSNAWIKAWIDGTDYAEKVLTHYGAFVLFGPELSGARYLQKLTGKDVYVTKVVYGGTSITRWIPGGTYATNVANQVALTQAAYENAGPVDVVWMDQGYSDGDTLDEATNYYARLTAMVEDWEENEVVPEGVPIIVADENSVSLGVQAYLSTVVTAKQDFVSNRGNAWLMDVTGVEMRPTNVHYSGAGLIEMGNRFASATMRAFGALDTEVLAADQVAAESVSAQTGNFQTMTVGGYAFGDAVRRESGSPFISDRKLLFYSPWKFEAGTGTNSICNWATGDRISTNFNLAYGSDDDETGLYYLVSHGTNSPTTGRLEIREINHAITYNDFFVAVKFRPQFDYEEEGASMMLNAQGTTTLGLTLWSHYAQGGAYPGFRFGDKNGGHWTAEYSLLRNQSNPASYSNQWHTLAVSVERAGTNSVVSTYWNGELAFVNYPTNDFTFTSTIATNGVMTVGAQNNLSAPAASDIADLAIGARQLTAQEAMDFHLGVPFKHTRFVAP